MHYGHQTCIRCINFENAFNRQHGGDDDVLFVNKFGADNNMLPMRDRPCWNNIKSIATLSEIKQHQIEIWRRDHAQLPVLSKIEELLIARMHPVFAVHLLPRGNQTGFSQQVITYAQDLQGFINTLPRNPKYCHILIVRQQNSQMPTHHNDFRVRRECVLEWLLFLQLHNPYYSDITIDDNQLQELPVEDCLPLTLLTIMNQPQPQQQVMLGHQLMQMLRMLQQNTWKTRSILVQLLQPQNPHKQH